jgi:hypothetical protein
MTLDEMLALLPDNTSGAIGADDLRAIITDLYNTAHLRGEAYAYDWTNQATVNTGQVHLNNGWSAASTILVLAETSAGGTAFNFGVLDASVPNAKIEISDASGRKVLADITGTSSDLGIYREIPITVTEVVGIVPTNNAAVTVTGLVLVP